MDRMKTFFKYLLMVVIFYFGSNSLIYASINNSYYDIANYQYLKSNIIEFSIDEAKATSMNGYLKGTIKNNSKFDIENQYIKIDFYSLRNVNVGTKYIKIENLKSRETTNFEVKFRYANVSYYEISVVEEI